ncbi:MAG TPA: hypothetical protein VLB83_00555 [Candidatus Paceibacterota bacterium]|nr:hypothetical protein [Candidatus Paceibacterota bacterium]
MVAFLLCVSAAAGIVGASEADIAYPLRLSYFAAFMILCEIGFSRPIRPGMFTKIGGSMLALGWGSYALGMIVF